MNTLDLIIDPVEDEKAFKLSLPILHSYIHFMECSLNISYRLEFKTWKVSDLQKHIFIILNYMSQFTILNYFIN